MKIFKSIWLLSLSFASTLFAETPQLGLILVAPGQQGQMIEAVMGESVHGESSSLSFMASYYKDVASENVKIAQAATKAREEYEKALRETGIPPQPALPPSEQIRKDTAGQAIVDRTKTSLNLRREQPFNIEARQENESKRLKAVQYYLTVANTTNRILRTDFANMADKVLALVNPSLSVEDRKVMLDIGAELLDFAVGIGASMAVDTFQAITGKHYRTWENLSEVDHVLSAASVMTLGFGGAGIRGAKAIARISEHLYGPGHAVLARTQVFEHVFDSATKFGFDLKSLKGGTTGDRVIAETLAGRGNLTSQFTLSSNEALDTGIKWVGDGYKELDSGVYRSVDNLRQFRMDNGSLAGAHSPGVPHVHLETYKADTGRFHANNHIRIAD
jgi:hypothetical protein